MEAFREALSSFLRSSVQRASARVLPFFPSRQHHRQSSISSKLSEVPVRPSHGAMTAKSLEALKLHRSHLLIG